MGRQSASMAGVLALTAALLFWSAAAFELEIPEYTVLHMANEYQVRIYDETVWVVAKVEDVSFARATTLGFHRLFQYIGGGNVNNTNIEMTAPVLTGVVPSAGPFCSTAFVVRLYLPKSYHKNPPTPLSELELEVEYWEKRVVAVRTFSGYAVDGNVAQEAEKLAHSLDRSDFAKNATYPISGRDSYSIAQYDSPFQFWDRHNEVWVGIDFPGHHPVASS